MNLHYLVIVSARGVNGREGKRLVPFSQVGNEIAISMF